MKSIVNKSLLLVCLFALVSQYTFSQKKHKNKQKKHHPISINHQGSETDASKGFWNLNEDSYGVLLELSSRKGSKFSLKRGSFFISFYPTSDELSIINSSSSSFSIVRAAGTINCDVSGKYTFSLNKEFEAFLDKEGITGGTAYDFIKLFLGAVDANYVLGIKNMGYQPTFRELAKLGILDISLDYVKTINNYYKGLDLNMLTKFGIHDVTPQYLQGLNDLGYGSIDANMVKKFAVHSISLDYIKGLSTAGYNNLDANMIKKFAIHSVSVDYINGLNALGYDLEPNTIKKFAIHSISLDYIRSLINSNIDKPEPSALKKAKIHGVSANFIKRANNAGHNSRDLIDYVKLKIHGI